MGEDQQLMWEEAVVSNEELVAVLDVDCRTWGMVVGAGVWHLADRIGKGVDVGGCGICSCAPEWSLGCGNGR